MRFFKQKRRIDRFNVEEAENFFSKYGINIHSWPQFPEIQMRNGDCNTYDIWFEDLCARMVRGLNDSPTHLLTGRYCTQLMLSEKDAGVWIPGEQIESDFRIIGRIDCSENPRRSYVQRYVHERKFQ
jgi:hypothetical protein